MMNNELDVINAIDIIGWFNLMEQVEKVRTAGGQQLTMITEYLEFCLKFQFVKFLKKIRWTYLSLIGEFLGPFAANHFYLQN